MEILELPTAAPRALGRAHGEHFRGPIHDLARLRLDLALSMGAFGSEDAVLDVARQHLPVLEAYDRALSEELLGIAEGADLDPARVVVLNHYTDLKDIAAEDCTTVAVDPKDGGPLIGQTWDMHGSAEPFVCMLRIPSIEGRPEVLSFTLTGCLALAGMNDAGLAVTINNLKSKDAKVGVVWPALVRRMLAERGTDAAKHVLMTAPMSSGHHYLFGDADKACAVETSGERKAVVFEATWAASAGVSYAHANHCLDADVGAVSWVASWSTSYARYDWITDSLKKSPVADHADLWTRLGSHDGYPKSLCTHMASAEEPHRMKTCGAVSMDLQAKTLYAVKGCAHGASPRPYRFGAGGFGA